MREQLKQLSQHYGEELHKGRESQLPQTLWGGENISFIANGTISPKSKIRCTHFSN